MRNAVYVGFELCDGDASWWPRLDGDRRHSGDFKFFAHPMIAAGNTKGNLVHGGEGAAGLEGAEDGFARGLFSPDAGEAHAGREMVAAGDEADFVVAGQAVGGIGFAGVAAEALVDFHERTVVAVVGFPEDGVEVLVRDGEGVCVEFLPEFGVRIGVRAEHVVAQGNDVVVGVAATAFVGIEWDEGVGQRVAIYFFADTLPQQ